MTRTTRRRRLTVAAALATVTVLAATACAPRTGTTDSSPEKIDAATLVTSLPAATTAVDEVTWAVVEGEPQTLDPSSSANIIIPNLCDSLLTVEPDFTLESGIAETAEWIDPVTFEITVRDGVAFWDGTPLTAADVAYSLERNRTPASQWYAAFALISSIETSGDDTVLVHFTAPDTTFRDALGGGGGAVMSKAFGDTVGQDLGTSGGGLMCAGPYRLDEWKPGTEISVTANPDYWNGAPLTERIRFVFVTDGATLTSALTAGEIDGAFTVPPGSRQSFEAEGEGRLIAGPSTASYSFGPASADSAAADPRVRQALSLAIDRSTYIDTVLQGLGEVQKTIVPPFVWSGMEAKDIYQDAYDALPAPEVDLDAAKKLIAESGIDTSVPLVLAVPAGAKEFSQTASIVQSAAKDIGLTISIDERQPADFGALFYTPELREGIDFVATTGYLEVPGVLGYPQLFMLPAEIGGIFNWSGYANDEVTADLQAARTATDATTAADAFVSAQEIFAADQLQVTLAGAYQLTYLSDDLTGITTSVAIYSSPWALHLGGE
ncbi:ABC transporter substrate-binding protein [Microbacterium sp. 1.5R]|uniref:ABC transporter substrate-binding protein n=1 Tax=Microbacterium sp. 1.5R TaxID=1916917 RepID=UPI00090B9CF9|nr:ABC transporter substrate-binding protein [Microbacterium sp. 1.5R]APH46104.1 ABC transporter substrate-binding protein [Microbacterium sp. 1.5R]